ncbi:MAG: tetratricopeptide repeat protein [Proteobacteria bacterium]|nr:tetratricopeptide repeat protein [Pseudomonadota bacterium]
MDIIDEVVEEVQHEKLLNLWRRYSIFIYIVLGCVIIGTGIYAFWKDQEEKEAKKASALYARGLKFEEAGNKEDAQKTFQEVITLGLRGFKALAELSLGNMMNALQQDTTKTQAESRKFLEDLISSSKTPSSLRKTGEMKLLLLDFESKNMSLLKERLEKYLGEKSMASSLLVQEIRASFEYQSGNMEKSYGLYEALLKNPKASHGIRHRALRMLMLLKSKEAFKSQLTTPDVGELN